MTQQELLQLLSVYAVGYDIQWNVVKYDADKAILKINSYLGANYPKISEVMLSPEHTYSLKSHGVSLPIIADEYFHSIIIPFMASEILARDEEFTTIYNKYVMDYNNGLFDMFQKEFNRVPMAFRQPNTSGVYFADESARPAIPLESTTSVPDFTFQVHYHLNNSYAESVMAPVDTHQYIYNDSVTVGYLSRNSKRLETYTAFSEDGIYAYTFVGWTPNPRTVDIIYKPEQEFFLHGDTELYAVWKKEYTLIVNNENRLTINSKFIFDSNEPAAGTAMFDKLIVPVTSYKLNYTSIGNLPVRHIIFIGNAVIDGQLAAGCSNVELEFNETSTYTFAAGCCTDLDYNLNTPIKIPKYSTMPHALAFSINNASEIRQLPIEVSYSKGHMPINWDTALAGCKITYNAGGGTNV